MPGDRAQKLANLRLTYGYMMTPPRKSFSSWDMDLEEKEWNEMRQVEWHCKSRRKMPEFRGW